MHLRTNMLIIGPRNIYVTLPASAAEACSLSRLLLKNELRNIICKHF